MTVPRRTRFLVATRSAHKLAEIRAILGAAAELVSLTDLHVPASLEEDDIEAFPTFRANALAKARFFASVTAMPTLADDSGIVVHALDGEPGVRSRRFSGRNDLTGTALDDANNTLLLDRLARVQDPQRTAHYVCAGALVLPSGRCCTAIGTCAGRILRAPRGSGGFGYDPLFLLPDLGITFGELDQAEKDRRSHRARAFRALASVLRETSP